jgi:hypothetical protein
MAGPAISRRMTGEQRVAGGDAEGVLELGEWKMQDRFLIPGTERPAMRWFPQPELGTVLTPNGGYRMSRDCLVVTVCNQMPDPVADDDE